MEFSSSSLQSIIQLSVALNTAFIAILTTNNPLLSEERQKWQELNMRIPNPHPPSYQESQKAIVRIISLIDTREKRFRSIETWAIVVCFIIAVLYSILLFCFSGKASFDIKFCIGLTIFLFGYSPILVALVLEATRRLYIEFCIRKPRRDVENAIERLKNAENIADRSPPPPNAICS